eukprot:2438026-Karenia_brevis.AAC.1
MSLSRVVVLQQLGGCALGSLSLVSMKPISLSLRTLIRIIQLRPLIAGSCIPCMADPLSKEFRCFHLKVPSLANSLSTPRLQIISHACVNFAECNIFQLI